jgi:hypothetical protein
MDTPERPTAMNTDGTLFGYLIAVDKYWESNGEMCEGCLLNEPERGGCQLLYARKVPREDCPGVLPLKYPDNCRKCSAELLGLEACPVCGVMA